MYVFDEAFDAWGMAKQPGDYNMFFESDWEADLTAFVRRDRSRACVILWSTGNEIIEHGGLGNGYTIATALAKKLRSLDHSRPISNAICSCWSGLDDAKTAEALKLTAEQSAGQNADIAPGDGWEEFSEPFANGLDIFGYNYLESLDDEIRVTVIATGFDKAPAAQMPKMADAVTPRQLSELMDIDYEVAKLLYTAYATDQSQYGQILNGLDNYKVPLYDMFQFIEREMDEGDITLDDDTQEELDDLFDQLDKAQLQLQSDDYARMVVYLDLPEESDETKAMLKKMHEIVGSYYPGDFYIVGNSTSAVDLASSFVQDNTLISVLSAFFVILVLLFTFLSAGLPVLLIMVIQGSIWIHFAVPAITGSPLYFLGYLIVNAIQMGANIDYAIVISSHYTELKKLEKPHEAIVDALNASFPTIFTSGTILASAGELISFMTTNPVISAIGECLGRGTIISMALVLGVLPQILVLGDFIIEKTSFEMKPIVPQTRQATGTMHLQGRVRGYVSGVIDADVNGVLRGQLNAIISTEDLKTQGTDEADEPDKDNPQLPESSNASPQDTETQQEKPKGGDGDEN